MFYNIFLLIMFLCIMVVLELKRVQHLVGDLQKQRQELSVAVRQLTDKSQNIGLSSSNSNIPATVNEFNDSNGISNLK